MMTSHFNIEEYHYHSYMDWVEELYESYTWEFYNKLYIESHNWEDSDQENKWLEKLYEKEYKPQDAAKIIERTYKLWNREQKNGLI